MHSVTSSPVSSKCTPPGTVPSTQLSSKKQRNSHRMFSKSRVLWPDSELKVLACMGSQVQSTFSPSFLTARSSGGSFLSMMLAPKRVIRVMRPGSLSGLSRSTMERISSSR